TDSRVGGCVGAGGGADKNQDFSNALKSDHLLRMLDTPSVTLEAFQSILNDPDVVHVPAVYEEEFATESCSNWTPPNLALPVAFSHATPDPSPLFDDSDPFSFLEDYLPQASSSRTGVLRRRADSTCSAISTIPIQAPHLLETRPVSKRRRREELTPPPPRIKAPRTRTNAKNYAMDEQPDVSDLVDPNLILTLEMCPIRKEFCCPYKHCSFGCNRRYNLKIHYMTHLPIAALSPKDPLLANVDMYSCFICNKVMRRRFDMQRHRLGMHGVPVDVDDDGKGWDGVRVEASKSSGDEGATTAAGAKCARKRRRSDK
ncbi:UNVERIFIED_CONTAM: hypothetical protein HDU68_006539, partial [Siphonaria sp. JEL0065]